MVSVTMTTASGLKKDNIAKFMGVLFLVQMFAGVWLNFFFYKPLFADPVQLSNEKIQWMTGIGVLMAIMLSAINFVVCLLSQTLLKGQFRHHFICAISLAAIALCMTVMEGNQLSEFATWIIYANSLEAESSALLDHLRQVLATGRNKTHFMAILISSVSLLAFYSLLLRARLLPVALLAFALIACFIQLIAVGHALFGQPIPKPLQLPLAINQLVLPLYLLNKGFDQQ